MFNGRLFSTLKLNNGDISFDGLGRLQWAVNGESIAQTVNIRLKTKFGELFYDEGFGLNIQAIKNTLKNTKLLESEIRYALVDDEKISDVELIDVILLRDNAILKIAVRLYDQSVVNVDFNIGGV